MFEIVDLLHKENRNSRKRIKLKAGGREMYFQNMFMFYHKFDLEIQPEESRVVTHVFANFIFLFSS
jgi:hypothetical protein